MGRRGYVPLRRLGNVSLRRRWVFLNAGLVLILRRQSKQDRRAAKANSTTNYSPATRASKLELALPKTFKTASFRCIEKF